MTDYNFYLNINSDRWGNMLRKTSGTQQLAVLADAVEGGGAECVDVVVVDVHGEGREVTESALAVGRDLVAGFGGIPGDAGEGLPPL